MTRNVNSIGGKRETNITMMSCIITKKDTGSGSEIKLVMIIGSEMRKEKAPKGFKECIVWRGTEKMLKWRKGIVGA